MNKKKTTKNKSVMSAGENGAREIIVRKGE